MGMKKEGPIGFDHSSLSIQLLLSVKIPLTSLSPGVCVPRPGAVRIQVIPSVRGSSERATSVGLRNADASGFFSL